jgi:predicted CopG family antitoxin
MSSNLSLITGFERFDRLKKSAVRCSCLCIDLCMATKTLSVDLEAYERLNRARKHPKESFSQVIRRATWAETEKSGRRILELMQMSEPATEETLRDLEAAQSNDLPPRDPWAKS